MKPMSTAEIQGVNLEILSAIDGFCKKHQIMYFLDSGTLIGAIRHKGFIPWDDDADILMPRPDYERFIKEWQDAGDLRLYAPNLRNSYLHYARVCEMRRTYFNQHSIWTLESPGVGVDVFPLDGAPDTLSEFDAHSNKITKLRNELWALRSCRTQRVYRHGFRRDLYGFLKDCVHMVGFYWRYLNFNRLMRHAMKKIKTVRTKYPFEGSKNCCMIIVTTGRRKFWETEWFDRAIDVEFCGRKFPAPIGYDARLRAEYGDYMRLPPEDQRGGHAACQTMMWRDK